MELPLILITNDDGVHAEGIRALKAALFAIARTVVVAPADEKSACSHAITLRRPLRHVKLETDVYSIDGTPADCVAVALYSDKFLPRLPDLVLSGINHGVNLGTDIYYSGTVAGAREAAMRGIPAMALSSQLGCSFDPIASIASQMALAVVNAPKEPGTPALLNVNFPRNQVQGVAITRLSARVYDNFVQTHRDSSGDESHWIGGAASDRGAIAGSDSEAITRDMVSVIPLAIDLINGQHLALANRVVDVYRGPSSVARDLERKM